MKADPLYPDKTLPMLLTVDRGDIGKPGVFCDWVSRNSEKFDDWLHLTGAVLVRGYNIDTPEAFRRVCAAIRPDFDDSIGDDALISLIGSHDAADDRENSDEVLLHNALSYAGSTPERLFYGCLKPSRSSDEAQLVDGREIFKNLRKDLRRKFEDLGVIYHRYLRSENGEPGTGDTWQEAFQSDDPLHVEKFLVESEMKYEWTDDGLRTSTDHASVVKHPFTGERCWCNQADRWHLGTLGVADSGVESISAEQKATPGIDTFGNHVTFGDGSEIPLADLLHVREVIRACRVTFPWKTGDLLVIDNVMAMHGQKAYSGAPDVIIAVA